MDSKLTSLAAAMGRALGNTMFGVTGWRLVQYAQLLVAGMALSLSFGVGGAVSAASAIAILTILRVELFHQRIGKSGSDSLMRRVATYIATFLAIVLPVWVAGVVTVAAVHLTGIDVVAGTRTQFDWLLCMLACVCFTGVMSGEMTLAVTNWATRSAWTGGTTPPNASS
jgi:hypothetical protein